MTDQDSSIARTQGRPWLPIPKEAKARELGLALRKISDDRNYPFNRMSRETIGDPTSRWIDKHGSGKQLFDSREFALIMESKYFLPEEKTLLAIAQLKGQLRAGERFAGLSAADCGNRLDIVGIGALNYDQILPLATSLDGSEGDLRSIQISSQPEISVDSQDDLIEHLEGILNANGPAAQGSLRNAYGGSTFNVIQLLGGPELACKAGFVGVSGESPLEGLVSHKEFLESRRGVDCRFVRSSTAVGGRCVSVIQELSSDETSRELTTWPGANVELAAHLAMNFWSIVDYLSGARIIHVTSLFDEDSPEIVADLIEYVHKHAPGVTVSFDPGYVWSTKQLEPVARILKASTMLFVNEKEIHELSKTHCEGVKMSFEEEKRKTLTGVRNEHTQAQNILRYMAAGDASVIVVKHKGATSVHRREMAPQTFDILPVTDVRDDTGAGDTFAAGYLAPMISPVIQSAVGSMIGMLMARDKLKQVGPLEPSDLISAVHRLLATER